MKHDLNFNEENIIAASEVIYESGEKITGIALLLSGKIEKTSSSVSGVSYRTAYDAGSFIAYNDLYCGLYSGDYKALSECVVVPFKCQNPAELIKTLDSVRGFIEGHRPAFHNYIKQLIMLYNALYRDISAFYNNIASADAKFRNIIKTASTASGISDSIGDMSCAAGAPDRFKITNLAFYETYRSLGNTPLTSDDIIKIISDFYGYYDGILSYLGTLVRFSAGDDEACLAKRIAKSSGMLTNDTSRDVSRELCAVIDDMESAASDLEKTMHGYLDFNINFDYSSLALCKSLITENLSVSGDLPRENSVKLTGVFRKLITYASYSKEETVSIYNVLEAFKKMPDKGATDDSARKLRKILADEYYKLYERVFLTYAENTHARPDDTSADFDLYIDIFLNYGLLDETVIDDDRIDNLTSKAPSPCGSPCTVFHMKDWLMSIYDGVNMPSKNEYDEEYTDYVRKRKKELNLTPEKERELLENGVLKVKYEINNMFKCNNRLLNGNLACFYPMLNNYSNEQPLSKLALTADIINDEFNRLTAIDFSAFYRESMYENLSVGISKEMVMREIHPVIILFPIYGINCVMWQEISGKRINNPGRFFMPAFFGGDFSLAIMRMVARFRWELCKTNQGLAWNDVTVPSLTSEYNDYLQFYRKNKELSSDKKEQIKNQLSRCRNNIRETFIQDYCTWIKFECTGAMRLNKIARRIFASYCPFPKQIRDNLEQQPLFAEAMVKFNRERQKKAKEISMHYNSLTRKGIELTKELNDTADFYTKY